MTPFETYQTYLALKQHFTSDYDYHKYNGKVKASVSSFKARRDRFFFEKLAKHQNPTEFLLANIVNGNKAYIKDLAYSEEAKQIYTKWLKTKESLSYQFQNEIANISNNDFICEPNTHPNLIRQYLAKKISLETLCVLCDLTGCLKYWDHKLRGDVIYSDVRRMIKKYLPFVQYDKAKMKAIVRKQMKGETKDRKNETK